VDGQDIGLEHTRFFIPTPAGDIPEQQLSALQDLAVAHAKHCFRNAGGPALYVYPLFNHRRAPKTKADAYALGQRFAEIVARNGYTHHSTPQTFRIWQETPEIHSYTVMQSVNGVDELWSGGKGGWVAQVKPAQIQACLDSKASRYPEYKLRATRIWLLVVNDMLNGGALCEIGDHARNATYAFPFDRAYWLESFEGEVIELGKSN
jgi:hypothetical protein